MSRLRASDNKVMFERRPNATRVVVFLSGLMPALMFAIVSCTEPTDPGEPRVEPVADASPPSQWHVLDDAIVVSLPDDGNDDELQAAIAVARASAPQERENWLYSNDEQKKRWAIKWAASTVDDRAEYVWVRPVAWSAHRVEGVLANAPLNELRCGKTLGELVSFPIEEMADWIRFLSDDPNSAYEGGYTLEVLARKYGTPGTQ